MSRGSLLGLSLICIALAWIAYERRKSEQGNRAVALLESHDAFVSWYVYPSPRRDFVKVLLGDDGFRKIESVIFKPGKVTDDDLDALGCLPRLSELTGCGAHVTDENISKLACLTKLTILDLSHSRLSDQRLKAISSLRELQILSLGHSNVSDEGIKLLTTLPLSQLVLTQCNVTDEGMKFIAEIHSLKHIDLTATDISDVGLAQLERLTSLKYVNITATPFITERGIQELRDAKPGIEIHDRFGRPNAGE